MLSEPVTDSVEMTGTVLLTGTAEPGSTVEITHIADDASSASGAATNANARQTQTAASQLVCSTVADAVGKWSCLIDELPEGDQVLEVAVTDLAGNVSPPLRVTVRIHASPTQNALQFMPIIRGHAVY